MSFDPGAIANIGGWWKTDAIVGLVDGDPVTTWPDSSGLGFDGTGSPTPIYHTGQINGLPATNWDGTKRVTTPADGSFPSGLTVFAVVRPTSAAGNPALVTPSATGGIGYRLTTAAKPQLNKQNVSQIALGSSAIPLNSWSIISVDFEDAGAGSAAHHFTNGTANGSTTSATTFTAGLTLWLGFRPGGSTDGWIGDIAEVITYERVLTATERGQVHSYFQDKYGIAVSDYIPSGGAPQTVTPIGIGSAETFGAAALHAAITLLPGGIASAEAIGAAALHSAIVVTPTGIAPAAGVGTPSLHAAITVTAVGIASGQALGVPAVHPGAVIVVPVGIASGEVVGTPSIIQPGAPLPETGPETFLVLVPVTTALTLLGKDTTMALDSDENSLALIPFDTDLTLDG